MIFSRAAQAVGIASAWALVALLGLYVVLLAYGLLTLSSPSDPIQGAVFAALEVLILLMSPALIGMLLAVHAWAAPGRRIFSAAAVVFGAMTALASGLLHGAILTLSHSTTWTAEPALQRALSFRWPSVAYAVDILAWDLWFPLAMGAASAVFVGVGLERHVRVAMIVSAVVAAVGLIGAATGDMRIRNIGIVGYTVGLAIVAVLLAALFGRTVGPQRQAEGSV